MNHIIFSHHNLLVYPRCKSRPIHSPSDTADPDKKNPFLALDSAHNRPDLNRSVSISDVRDLVFTRLRLKPRAACIFLLSRNSSAEQLAAFADRVVLDRSREAAGLHRYHDTGPHVYTALHYQPSTAQQRRYISNEDQVLRRLKAVFGTKYGVCVERLQLDGMSIREQFRAFSRAKLVIAQHGAGLAYSLFLPPGAIVLELEPMTNRVFEMAAHAAGVEHRYCPQAELPKLYERGVTAGPSEGSGGPEEPAVLGRVALSPKEMVYIASLVLQGWTAPGEEVEEVDVVRSESSGVSPLERARKGVIPGGQDPGELAVIREMLSRPASSRQPLAWDDSGYASNRWAGKGWRNWHVHMRAEVYDKGASMPMKIMASPSNVYSFYDTYAHDVELRDVIPPDRCTDFSCARNGSKRMVYVDLHSREEVLGVEGFRPFHRQVSGVGEQEDIGFNLLDHREAVAAGMTRVMPPVISEDEHYYIRVSSDKGMALYDRYAREVMPMAFNPWLWADAMAEVPRVSLFFSSRGAVTNLHYDEGEVGAALCQLKGRKRFLLWPPLGQDPVGSEDAVAMGCYPSGHPLYRRSRHDGRDPHLTNREVGRRLHSDVTIGPGQCLYIPAMWWHYVETKDEDTVSVRFNL